MKTLPFHQVDAFARMPFEGNPAAVMPLDAWPDDALLQKIAAENNLAETAFTVPATDGDADHELRWFTPTTEVALCGHATLASGHVLIGDRAAVRFRTRRSGVLTVTRDGDGYAMDLPAAAVAAADGPDLLAALGVDGAVHLAASGQETAVVLLHDAAAVRAVAPDMRALRDVRLMAIVTAPGDESDWVSRVFVPAWGVDEDPVTGSASAVLARFWAGRLGRAETTGFQASARGGRMRVRSAGDRATIVAPCLTVIEGVFRLP